MNLITSGKSGFKMGSCFNSIVKGFTFDPSKKYFRREVRYWKECMSQVAKVDFGSELPDLNEKFLDVWASHYAHISVLSKLRPPVLEIGTGYGVLATGISKYSEQGIYTLEHPTRSYFYRREYKKLLKKNKVKLIGNDLRDGLPFKDKSFSQVFLCDVIEHLEPDTVINTLTEISRILKPKGEIILSTPNLNRFSNLIRLILGHTVNPPLKVDWYGHTCGHIREFAPKEILRLLRKYDLIPKRWSFGLNPFFTSEAFAEENIFSFRQASLINFMTNITKHFLSRTGDEIYILSQKPG